MQARTHFAPEPRSAAEARHWVRGHLERIGRSDLVPAAEAGVSELITNGILHAQTPIGLHLTRSQRRVIIEVYDGSPMVQQPAVEAASQVSPESTIGRGLRIVRAHAREWGVATTPHGKAVWFQPAASDSPDMLLAGSEPATENGGDIHPGSGLDAALDALAQAFPESCPAGITTGSPMAPAEKELVQVRLLGVPPFVVHHYRKRWLELVREMQLVALGERSPQQEMAQRLCAAAHAVHSGLYLIEQSQPGCTPAASDDGAVVDTVFEVPRSMREAFVEIRRLARELERHWAGTRLLFVHPGEQAVQLREWWLGELIAQIDGHEPTPWPGRKSVRDEALL